jgi:hypothetical protein
VTLTDREVTMCLRSITACLRGTVLVLAAASFPLLVALAGCTASAPAPLPSFTSASPSAVASGELPPTWVLNEALWQALAVGDPHPLSIRWTLTTPSRASGLDRGASWLKGMRGAKWKVYAVEVLGDFTLPGYDAGPQHAAALMMLIDAQSGGFVGFYHSATGYDLSALRGVHACRPAPRVTLGVWGLTCWAGGPFPGGPHPLGMVTVQIYRGGYPFTPGKPVATVVSDVRGFFTLAIAPGRYTFLFSQSRFGPSSPTTVIVRAGQPLAVLVAANVP